MISENSNPFSLKNLYSCYTKCRKGKGGSFNTIKFQTDLFANLRSLSESLEDKTYQPSRSVCFYFEKPKLREVIASDFRDRVVHRLLVDQLEPMYEKSFIKDSYACRKEKGTHAAVDRLKDFIRSGTRGGKGRLYFLQLDIKGYFFEMDKEILLNIISRRIKDEKLFWLAEKIIRHDPTKNFTYKGKIPPQGVLPPHKTLFHPNKKKGLPIGNLTSQFFANLYLNELDQYVKRNLGVKRYLRYMDDFILLSDDPEELIRWRECILKFLQEKLALELKEIEVPPKSVYKGIDFLGYFIKPRYLLVRRRVVTNMKKALRESVPLFSSSFGWAGWKKAQAKINSYLGHFSKANSSDLLEYVRTNLHFGYPFLYIPKNSLKLRHPRPDRFRSYSAQVRYYRNLLPDQTLIFQVGRRYDIYLSSQKIDMFFARWFQIPIEWPVPGKLIQIGRNLFKILYDYAKKIGCDWKFFYQSVGVFEHRVLRIYAG